MSDNGGQIRIILRWIQIKDNKEAMWDDEGEFRFRQVVAGVGVGDGVFMSALTSRARRLAAW